jgi:hypothetical protein
VIFGCGQSLKKGTLLVKRVTLSSLSWLLFKLFSWNFVSLTLHAWPTNDVSLNEKPSIIHSCYYKWYKFRCDRLIMDKNV